MTKPPVKRSTYGQGTVTKHRGRFRVRVPLGNGKEKTIGTYDDEAEARRIKNAYNMQRGPIVVGTTLRQWGVVYLHRIQDHKSIASTTNTWNSVIGNAPFVDVPLDLIAPAEVCAWAQDDLPKQLKVQSKLKNGKRTRVQTKETISRKYATNALGLLARALDKACAEGLLTSNPAKFAEIPINRHVAIEDVITYLPAHELELLLSCAHCARELGAGMPPGDVNMLVQCPHMPFENRVVFTLAMHQAPREGELAGMDWSRVDWAGHGWTIAKSWEGTTKNRKTRWQALIPRSERVLRKWWELKGRPTKGLMFPAHRCGRKNGPKALFVLSLPADMSRQQVSALAAKEGFDISPHYVTQIRSKQREKISRIPKPYAKGHDWGFADHKEGHLTRLGWWRRVGITTQVRFHDSRDTAATHLLSGTWGPAWDIKSVSKHLGHSSIKVTEERYAHLTRDAQRQAAQSVESEPNYAAIRLANPDQTRHKSGTAANGKQNKNTEKTRAPEAGLEPTTNRLTARGTHPDFMELRGAVPGLCRLMPQRAIDAANSLLERVAKGEKVSRRELTTLASTALQVPHVVLARAVLKQKGPLALKRGLELARLIGDASASSVALYSDAR